MRPNTVKALWHEDKPAIGAWLSSASTMVTDQMTHAGYDWLLVDGEHSPVDIQTAVQMMQVISGTETIPFARPQWNDLVEIKRLLDGGAYGCGDPLGEHDGGGGAGGGGVPLPAGGVAGDGAVPGGAVRGGGLRGAGERGDRVRDPDRDDRGGGSGSTRSCRCRGWMGR